VVTWTEADFERLSWHDCHVWGIEFRVGTPDENDWTSDLAFDIDYIVEWVSGSDGRVRFRRFDRFCIERNMGRDTAIQRGGCAARAVAVATMPEGLHLRHVLALRSGRMG